MKVTSLELERAEKAFEYVKEAVEKLKNNEKNYRSHLKKLPMLIKNNGLAAAIAFVYSKSRNDEAWKEIYSQIEDWCKKGYARNILGNYNKELAYAISSLRSSHYRALTVEILSLLQWMRMYVEGMVEE